jgi:solute carrier family 25 (mitochondrial carnitine/acylcarnitine transporter), member 20/29
VQIGGAVGWLICYPLDLVKTRLQGDDLVKPQYRGTIHCTVTAYREGGIRIFGRGLGATLVRSFLVDGVIFLVYDLILERLLSPDQRRHS